MAEYDRLRFPLQNSDRLNTSIGAELAWCMHFSTCITEVL